MIQNAKPKPQPDSLLDDIWGIPSVIVSTWDIGTATNFIENGFEDSRSEPKKKKRKKKAKRIPPV